MCVSQSSHTCAPLLVFSKTSVQPHFAVVNCSDAVMSVFCSHVLTCSLIFLQLWTAVSQRWVYFPPICEPGTLIIYNQFNDTQIKGSACRRICILWQETSPKRWFGNKNMTSYCDVTNSAHQIQMITICHWLNPPMKIFCVRHWDSLIDIVFVEQSVNSRTKEAVSHFGKNLDNFVSLNRENGTKVAKLEKAFDNNDVGYSFERWSLNNLFFLSEYRAYAKTR